MIMTLDKEHNEKKKKEREIEESFCSEIVQLEKKKNSIRQREKNDLPNMFNNGETTKGYDRFNNSRDELSNEELKAMDKREQRQRV